MKTAPLEVIILNDHASVTGGASAVAIASACELAARGVAVIFVAAVGPVAPELTAANVRVVCLEQEEIAQDPHRGRAFLRGLRNAPAIRELRALLADRSPKWTIVHVHSWTKALSPFAIAVAQKAGLPLVITLHDYFITCPNGGFFDYTANTICSRTPLSAACWTCHCDRRNYAQKLWRGVRTTLQNRVLRVPDRANRLIAVSEFSLARMRPFLPPAVPTTVVRNPIAAARCAPVDAAAKRAFVYVGRLEQEKGALLFAEAANAAGVAAKFIGAGAMADELRRRCPAATFTGWLDRAAIRRELDEARCLVFPPLWYETLGLVVIEAAAAGIPALVADRCAATDFVNDGANGRHFTHGSSAALAAVLAELAHDDSQVGRLGRSAYAGYWADPWTPQRHVDQLLTVYQETLAARAAGRIGGNRHGSVDRFGAGSGRRVPVRGDAVPLPE